MKSVLSEMKKKILYLGLKIKHTSTAHKLILE